jgi:hypothetical protein
VPNEVKHAIVTAVLTTMGGHAWGGEEVERLGGQPFLNSIRSMRVRPVRGGPGVRVEIKVSC